MLGFFAAFSSALPREPFAVRARAEAERQRALTASRRVQTRGLSGMVLPVQIEQVGFVTL